MARLPGVFLLACVLVSAAHNCVDASQEASEVHEPAADCVGSDCQPPPDGAAAAAAQPTLHTLIATECSRYFTWQTIGLVHSIKQSGHPGPVTRLLSCTKASRAECIQ
jgi:hypothetical protein